LPPETRRVLIRTGMVIGLSGGALEQLAKIYATGLAGVMGSGKQYLSWVHLDDLVGIIYAAIQDKRYVGPINAVAPEPVTFQEFHESLCDAMEVGSGPKVPKALVRLLLGEKSAVVLESQRLASTMVQSLGYKFLYPELELCLASQFSDQLEPGVSWLIQKIWLPVSVEKVWEFFSDEHNLEQMTPPTLNFKVKGKSTAEISRGTTIDYALKVHGFPLRWRTLIESWEHKVRFIDRQIRGPYRLWHHTHHFYQLGGGTLMIDEVQYKLPFGKLGLLLAGWLVAKDVRSIFAFRNRFAATFFGRSS
jgi:ligand-binding SRPBCC domain-containing protein